jgi:hypothetical protein
MFGITLWRWRDIRTARKDVPVYLAKPSRKHPVRCQWRDGPHGFKCWMSDDDGRELKEPTHWAPVPKLPRWK